MRSAHDKPRATHSIRRSRRTGRFISESTHTQVVLSKSREFIKSSLKARVAVRRAAALAGMDEAAFVAAAAHRAAIETIALHERTRLAPEDHAAFFAALDAPAEPAPALRDAFARHAKRHGTG